MMEKLTFFVDDFEEKYKNDLENWSGEVGFFDSQGLQELVLKLFK